jgi:gluconolactonase
VRRLSPALDRILAADAPVETIASGVRWAEGPVWLARERALLFSDPPANIVRRWSRASGVATFLAPSGAAAFDDRITREPGANGLALDAGGRLLIADSGNRAIRRLDLRTRRATVLVDRFGGKRFNSPNDLQAARDGAVWFTDPPYGLKDGDASSAKELAHNGVYRWRPGGEAALIDDGLTRPNGIALSPDERRLFVAVSDEAAPRIYAYDIDRAGRARDRRVFVDFTGRSGPGLPDGLKVAADGTIFCTGPGGLHVLSPEGEPLGLIETGGPVANCAFGEDGRALFLAANDRVLRVSLKKGR